MLRSCSARRRLRRWKLLSTGSSKPRSAVANYRNVVSQTRIILRTVNASVPLTRVDQNLLEQFRQRRIEQGCGPQTIKHGMNCILGAIRLAKKHGYECVDVEPPSIRIPNTRLRYLSFDEERRLLAELDPKRETNGMTSFDKRDPNRIRLMQDNLDLVILLLDTGARYSEIANIAWDRIDLTNKSIRLWRPKVQNESILFMTDRVRAILARRWKSRVSEFVFSSKSLGPRGYSAIAIRKAMRRAGLTDCTIHTLATYPCDEADPERAERVRSPGCARSHGHPDDDAICSPRTGSGDRSGEGHHQ